MTNFLILLYMYILEGIPYGLQSRFLPLILRNKGISLTELGFYKFLYFPWILKCFYALFIDKYCTKRLTLIFSLFGLFFVTCLLSYSFFIMDDERKDFLFIYMSFFLFSYNFFAATQDIAVDGFALSIIKENEVSLVNTVQVSGYKLGGIIGGGMLLWLSNTFHTSFLLLIISLIYFMGLCFCVCNYCWDMLQLKESEVSGNVRKKRLTIKIFLTELKSWANSSLDVFYSILFNSLKSQKMIMFLLIYKLGEQGMLNMLPLFLFDFGNSLHRIAFWTGILGQLFSLSGSVFGHHIQIFFKSPFKALLKLMIIRIVLHCPLVFVSMPTFGIHFPNFTFYFSVLLMNITLFVSGAITTIVFTLMMHCTRSESPDVYQATHYTVLSTAELLGKLLFGPISGYFADKFGYCFAQLGFVHISLLPVFFLWKHKDLLTFL